MLGGGHDTDEYIVEWTQVGRYPDDDEDDYDDYEEDDDIADNGADGDEGDDEQGRRQDESSRLFLVPGQEKGAGPSQKKICKVSKYRIF